MRDLIRGYRRCTSEELVGRCGINIHRKMGSRTHHGRVENPGQIEQIIPRAISTPQTQQNILLLSCDLPSEHTRHGKGRPTLPIQVQQVIQYAWTPMRISLPTQLP